MLNGRKSAVGLALAIILVVAAVSGIWAAEPTTKGVEPVSWGKVFGRVYDAATGQPIAGATVVVQQDGQFADKGRTVAETSPIGEYKCEAELGKVSSKINFGRFLSTGLVGLFSGGAKEVSKRVDVSRLNLRVTKTGYQPFESVVVCRTVDAASFNVTMEPILLTGAKSSEVSTSADGWGVVKIEDFAIEPAILRPGEKAVIKARVRCPATIKPDKMMMNVYSVSLGFKTLKMEKNPTGDVLLFSKEITAKKPKKALVETALVLLMLCPLDVAEGGSSKSCLYQVVTTDAEAKAAEIRSAAYKLSQSNDNAQAVAKRKELCALPEALASDFVDLGASSSVLHDYATTADALKRAVDITPEKERTWVVGSYAQALVENKQYDKVISEFVPVVEAIKEKDRPKKVSVYLMAAIGTAYIETGQIDKAKAINEALTKWPTPVGDASLSEFHKKLRFAQAEAALKSNPQDAQALADYGRALLDHGRWEEAVDNLRASLKIDPSIPAVKWDLGYALLHAQGSDTAVKENFDEALVEAEKQVGLGEGQQKSKDFFAWHKLGLLLYRKAIQQQQASNSSAAETFKRSQEMLVEALKCGRAGMVVNEGYYSYMIGYTGPRVKAIAGFAYSEANSDFLMLESLRVLETHPTDYLAHFNIATALIDLGQIDLATLELQKTTEQKPDFCEAKFANALIARQTGKDADAVAMLCELTKLNPRHPRANLTLAEMYTAEGNMEQAAACLARHAQYYGRQN
ncbi:MAG: tetratricopeptide repeat protein [Armatimonadota bacterium]|nr:tetratricopeptide repeat protein [Armatimonadota bacterium]